ncbi:pyridine nucleotide-disulfide oxidoreductase [Rhodanobacter glycinis]|uniref:Pyridine nucleotide-disulfide oxidoreductase n=1 Tax=Rhodanobacter glycinis TaxID=582702 RepID=A0A502FGE1_9GAMM|nr:FAD/NAD(P)-binding protein [Rhodanobacter glycinis]TPG11038.1 pyridine nucleotide-disulfide oxidoreductase [Rhodanobacter glycinis]TPG48527.1 pyridine nucleotide-disulfide oxidoreductase [Rhodanobacter glycinis]
MFRRVAIIGGGAAAATLLSEMLERQPPQPLHLDWYTGGEASARGVAYGTASERHLLNVRAASMSMFAGKPRGFLDFVQRDDPAIAGTDFLPRRRYGDYLEAEVARALQQGNAHGHDVNIIPFAVDALVPERDGVTVIHGEESRRVDAAVLALGALPPQPLPGVSTAALDCGRYVVDPWRLLAHRDAWPEPPRKVVLIGLGLTAVDVLLELSARWPQTAFIAISRHGLLPEAHLHAAAVPADDSAELIEAMRDAPDIRHWLRLLRETITQHGSEWRTIVDSLRPHLPGLWGELPLEQRARFMRHARWAWERARHRMPPQVREALTALEQGGRLQRQRGRMQSVEVAGDAVQLTLVRAGQTHTLTADLVIQTVGLNTDVRRTQHRLISQLLTNAHIAPDPLGLGVLSDTDGHLQRDGAQETPTHWPHVFAIGSLLRGTLWESTAMPEIRQQARHLADQLLTG